MNGDSRLVGDSQRAREVLRQLPSGGLFAGQDWRIAGRPFPLGKSLVSQFEKFGRVLLKFYQASSLLYRQSCEGKQPAWVAEWLDRGKPPELVALQRESAFRNETPRVIRPDVLLTDGHWVVTELDSVPGGIGLTGWLNQVYSDLPWPEAEASLQKPIGGSRGMVEGFQRIFGDRPVVHLVVSDESSTYRPEMEWLAGESNQRRMLVQGPDFRAAEPGSAVYRFFELFDVDNVPAAWPLFERAAAGDVFLTAPPCALFEEKMLFALLWNRNLEPYWHRELGAGFFSALRAVVPYTWLVDPAPLPPQGAIPELNLTDWKQLAGLSQRERQLILKISGFSPKAWGARGVHLGSDLSSSEWESVVLEAIANAGRHPYVLQRYHKPRVVSTSWLNRETGGMDPMDGRTRLCPYYFVEGEGDARRAHLGGVLATTCPADKKIIHGMSDAILAPCCIGIENEGQKTS